jgi:hypothetical protein
MDRTWLLPRLLPACAMVLLSACAGDTGNDGTTQSGDPAQEPAQGEEYQPGRFPTQGDHIIPGWGSGTGGGGVGGGGTTIPAHGDPPLTGLSDRGGPYWVDSYEIDSGRVYYPRDAPAPFAGLSLCGGFLNSGVEMTSWGDFFASWGIVTVITWTGIFDTPNVRGWALAAAVEELKGENSNPLSPVYQKMSDRYGTAGYSMGGGGSTVAAAGDSTHKVSIGLAPWTPTGFGVSTPSLFICGSTDLVAGCSHNDWAYAELSESVPKMNAMVSGGHLQWFGPDAGWGAGGGLALGFAKVFLEGDTRWKAPLLAMDSIYETNIY